jgi:hypothetical protein
MAVICVISLDHIIILILNQQIVRQDSLKIFMIESALQLLDDMRVLVNSNEDDSFFRFLILSRYL